MHFLFKPVKTTLMLTLLPTVKCKVMFVSLSGLRASRVYVSLDPASLSAKVPAEVVSLAVWQWLCLSLATVGKNTSGNLMLHFLLPWNSIY